MSLHLALPLAPTLNAQLFKKRGRKHGKHWTPLDTFVFLLFVLFRFPNSDFSGACSRKKEAWPFALHLLHDAKARSKGVVRSPNRATGVFQRTIVYMTTVR